MKEVGPNLYRTALGKYYALVKKGGKQFRRSLKTTDFALAKRRLRDLQEKAARLVGVGDASARTMRFEDLAERWLAMRKAELKPNSYSRRSVAVNPRPSAQRAQRGHGEADDFRCGGRGTDVDLLNAVAESSAIAWRE